MPNNNASSPSIEDCRQLLEDLPGLPVPSRIEVLERLIHTSSFEIRQQMLHLGSALLSDRRLVSYLRNEEDAVLRNAGLEILKLRGGRGFHVALDLLTDPDPDVVLQAVLVLDHLKNPRALEPLLGILNHRDSNVKQAVIVAIGHLGDSRAVPSLIPFLDADPWLQMAAVEALGDLRSPRAVEPLTGLLTDLMLGPLAAEALARIGGLRAYEALAGHWLSFRDQLDVESMLGLLAHVLEGLEPPTEVPEGLRDSIAGHLEGEREIRAAAARALLALGEGRHQSEALEALAGTVQHRDLLPACLRQRPDLIETLLAGDDPLRIWGFLLASQHPAATPPSAVARGLDEVDEPEGLAAIATCLIAVTSPRLDEPLIDLYLRLPCSQRRELHSALACRKSRLRGLIDRHPGLTAATRLVLLSLADEPAEALAAELVRLSDRELLEVVPQLFDRPDVLGLLPWDALLDREPEVFVGLAADVAVRVELRDLLPHLRRLLGERPGAELVRAVGELGDRDSVTVLRSLRRHRPDLDPVILKSLGEIGGHEAREELRQAIDRGDEDTDRLAYRALSLCATEDDELLFLAATQHTDWNVRLAAAEVLGRSARSEHLAALARLASDPISIVSQRALSFLES